MKTVVVVLVLILLMVAGGWLVFDMGSESASVEFRADEAGRDVEEAVDETRNLIDRVHVEEEPDGVILDEGVPR